MMRYPGEIKAGSVSKRTFCTVDLLPTIAELAGAALPKNPIDGKNVWDLIVGKAGATNPHDYYPFSTGANVRGRDQRRWTVEAPSAALVPRWSKAGNDGAAGKYRQEKIDLSLFDMENDPLETTNVIDKFPDVAARMKGYAEAHRAEFYA